MRRLTFSLFFFFPLVIFAVQPIQISLIQDNDSIVAFSLATDTKQGMLYLKNYDVSDYQRIISKSLFWELWENGEITHIFSIEMTDKMIAIIRDLFNGKYPCYEIESDIDGF